MKDMPQIIVDKKVFDKITIGLIIFMILVIAGTIIFIRSEAKQCLANPYIYGASKMGGVQCFCSQMKDGGFCPAKFSFNDNEFIVDKTSCGSIGLSRAIDFNQLNITEISLKNDSITI